MAELPLATGQNHRCILNGSQPDWRILAFDKYIIMPLSQMPSPLPGAQDLYY